MVALSTRTFRVSFLMQHSHRFRNTRRLLWLIPTHRSTRVPSIPDIEGRSRSNSETTQSQPTPLTIKCKSGNFIFQRIAPNISADYNVSDVGWYILTPCISVLGIVRRVELIGEVGLAGRMERSFYSACRGGGKPDWLAINKPLYPSIILGLWISIYQLEIQSGDSYIAF